MPIDRAMVEPIVPLDDDRPSSRAKSHGLHCECDACENRRRTTHPTLYRSCERRGERHRLTIGSSLRPWPPRKKKNEDQPNSWGRCEKCRMRVNVTKPHDQTVVELIDPEAPRKVVG